MLWHEPAGGQAGYKQASFSVRVKEGIKKIDHHLDERRLQAKREILEELEALNMLLQRVLYVRGINDRDFRRSESVLLKVKKICARQRACDYIGQHNFYVC